MWIIRILKESQNNNKNQMQFYLVYLLMLLAVWLCFYFKASGLTIS